MHFSSKARAFARAPLAAVPSGAIAGAALGLALGGVYLVGGMAHGAGPTEAPELAGLAQGYSAETAAGQESGFEPGPSAQVSLAGAMTALRGSSDPQPFQHAVADRAREIDCLAQAVYYEARGEGAEGQAAVAQVVLNRTRHPAFPSSVCGVVFQGAQRAKGCQFSFACDGSLSRRRDSEAWSRAKRIATRAFEGKLTAGVGSATHFHVTSVQPGWTGLMRVAQVGAHVFYKFSGRAGGKPALAKDEAEVLELAGDAPVDSGKVMLTSGAETAALQAPVLIALPDAVAPVPAKPDAKPAKTETKPAGADAKAVKVEAAVPKPDKPAANDVILPTSQTEERLRSQV